MDRLAQMRIFVAVAEEQGFAAAARRLQTSPPAVTRAVAGLERSLGVVLLNRTTRAVRVTDAGRRYLEDVRQILLAVEAADDAVAGINTEPTGRLAVTAPSLFGRQHVIPAVAQYLAQYPGTEVDTMFVDRVVNLVEEGFDVGVRIGELPDSSLRALRVGEVGWVVVAAPEYLAANGQPGNPADLHKHDLIVTSAGEFQLSWRFRKGNDIQMRVQPRLKTTTNDAAIEAALRGVGIARLLSYQVADDIKQGRLVPLLSGFEPKSIPVNVIHREGRNEAVRIRAFIDLLVSSLRDTADIN